MDIIKESGKKEEYKREKFCSSLEMAGASKSVVDRVCRKIEENLKEGTTTEELFRKAFEYLSAENIEIVARYSLKRGIAALGPAGFFFEQYVERILQAYGFETQRNVLMRGVCVSHEVDIVARKENELFLVEAKYHNRGGLKTDVTVAMYADARLADITPVEKKKESGWHASHRMWLITNTKFTTTAITYGKCKSIRMTGWSYPREHSRHLAGHSLEEMIIAKKLYPVTVLPAVARSKLSEFGRVGLMLVADIAALTPDALAKKTGFDTSHTERMVSEAFVALAGKK